MEQQALEQNCVERSGVGSWMNGQGTWIPLPSGVGIGSALKDGCGDVGASLVRESPQLVTWIQYNRHQVWGESLVRDSLQLGDCSRQLSVKVDIR